MDYINRAISNKVIDRASKSKCLLLTGARQVGKSTLLKHIFNEYNYTSFDDRITRSLAADDPKLFFMNNTAPLIIDEVQKESSVLEEIKIKVDSGDARGQYILTGSQNLALFKNMSESLAGRVSIMELGGLSLREIKNVTFNKHFVPSENYINEREKELISIDNIWEIIHRGSYPELYESDREWDDFYSSYINTYIERDINELISSDGVTFMNFLVAIAARTGQMLDYANLSNQIGVSAPTIKNWVSILERTGIIYLLQPYNSNALNRAIRRPKIYFRDTGLVSYLTKWSDSKALSVSAFAGSVFETFVVSEIIKSYVNEGLDYRFNIFYYRGKDKLKNSENEIDLIIEENGTLYPIEIKLTGTPKASMASTNTVLDKIPDKKRGMGAIICMTEKKMYLRENLISLPIIFI